MPSCGADIEEGQPIEPPSAEHLVQGILCALDPVVIEKAQERRPIFSEAKALGRARLALPARPPFPASGRPASSHETSPPCARQRRYSGPPRRFQARATREFS